METISFTHNWNNKLYCRSFSTVRIENPIKYRLHQEYRIFLNQVKGKPPIDRGVAVLRHIEYFNLFDVNPAVCYLDANLNKETFIKLVLTMYKNSGIDFNTKRMSFLVLQFISPNQSEVKAAETRNQPAEQLKANF